MRNGFFITFEGVDGLGKSTQVTLLANHLKQYGHDVALTKEPGDGKSGSNVGDGVRNLVFYRPTTKAMHPGVADMLFLADHIQNSGDIAELMNRGKVVISDRYADSQFAYAASEGKKCPQWALDTYLANYGTVPDLTILLIARGPQVFATWEPTHANIDEGGELSVVRRERYGEEDISWALDRAQKRRGVEAGKQDGKAWNSVKEQRCIQEAYLQHLRPLERTAVIDQWEGDPVGLIHQMIAKEVDFRIAAWQRDRVLAQAA